MNIQEALYITGNAEPSERRDAWFFLAAQQAGGVFIGGVSKSARISMRILHARRDEVARAITHVNFPENWSHPSRMIEAASLIARGIDPAANERAQRQKRKGQKTATHIKNAVVAAEPHIIGARWRDLLSEIGRNPVNAEDRMRALFANDGAKVSVDREGMTITLSDSDIAGPLPKSAGELQLSVKFIEAAS